MPRGRKVLDRTGCRYGQLLVIRRVEVEGKRRPHWLCVCDCGTETVVTADHLSQGTRSCGCLQRTARTKAVPKYAAIHMRLKVAFGPASDYECIDCGKPALQWSYDHKDPDAVMGTNSRGRSAPYSLDLDHYEPRCLKCHRRFDREREGRH